MISAPNHRPLLNGSKVFLLCLSALMLLGGCFLFKGRGGNDRDEDITNKNGNNKDTTVVVKKDTVVQPTPHTRPVFQISVMLPFYLDSVDAYNYDMAEPTLYPGALRALEFYEGMQLAIDSLRGKGLKIRMYVFDTQNDTNKVKALLTKPEVQKSNMIIGPVYNHNLRLVAKFAKEHKIHLFSPFSPSKDITTDNPYYVMLNASIDAHCSALADWITANYDKRNVLITTKMSDFELAMARRFVEELGIDSNRHIIVETRRTLDTSSVTHYLSRKDTSVIIVPSLDEAYVNYMTNLLHHIYKKYPIVVVGMPTWQGYESLRIEYLQHLNVHISKSYWIKENEDADMINRYQAKYHMAPTESVYRGYDLMLYLGQLMDRYELEYGQNFANFTYPAHHTITKIRPHDYHGGKFDPMLVDFYENHYVHILKYKDWSLWKVN